MKDAPVSTPVLVGAIAVAVLIVGFLGWFFLGRQEKYPGFQAPGPMVRGQMPPGGVPGMDPRMIPGRNAQPASAPQPSGAPQQPPQ